MFKCRIVFVATIVINNLLLRDQPHNTHCDGLLFLSDIIRPAFLIDLQALQRADSLHRTKTGIGTAASNTIPPILLHKSNDILMPIPIDSLEKTNWTCLHTFDQTLDPIDVLRNQENSIDASNVSSGDACFGYIHGQVTNSSMPYANDTAFLCQLNLDFRAIAQIGNNNNAIGSSRKMTMVPVPAH
jgi:hypothetical protein